MTHVLTGPSLKLLDHRLLWWMILAQGYDKGFPTGIVPKGWRERARADLKTHPGNLYKATKRLERAGLVEAARFSREVKLRGEAFS